MATRRRSFGRWVDGDGSGGFDPSVAVVVVHDGDLEWANRLNHMALNALKQMRRENVNNLELYKKVVRFQNGVEIICEVNHGVEKVRINTPVALPAAAEDIDVVVEEEVVVPPVETESTICPAFEISDGSGNIIGILVCDTGEWTSTGTFYEIETSAADPFEYGNWMCYYDSKPFSGDLADKEIYNSDRVVITDIAPCGYHGTVVTHDSYELYILSPPVTDYMSQSICILNETIDSGVITVGETVFTIHNIIEFMSNPIYNPNYIGPLDWIVYINSQFSFSHLVYDYSPFNTDEIFAFQVSADHTELSSNLCANTIISSYVELPYSIQSYHWNSNNIFLNTPTVSNYNSQSIWSAIYINGKESFGQYNESAEEIITSEDTSSSININLIVSGNVFSAFSTANTTLYGSDETLVRAIFYAPLLSSLRMYSIEGVIYVVGSLMEFSSISGNSNTSPKVTYFMVKTGDSEVQTLSLDSLYTVGGIPYHILDDGPCYGKFRLVKIERPEEE